MDKAHSGAYRLLSSTTLIVGLAMISIGLGHGQAEHQRSSTEAPVPSRGKMAQDLFLAIDHRDAHAVQSLLDQGADPNSRNGLEFTPMHIAAASFQPDVMQALLAAGAKPDTNTIYGTPLTFAAMSGDVPGANILLSKGAKVNVSRDDGATVLMMASNAGSPELVGELLKRKANVNAKNSSDTTALMYAARGGHLEVGKQLIAAGASIDKVDEEGQTPLMIAAMRGHADFVQLLLQHGAKPNARDANGQTALMLAANYGDFPNVAKALIKAGADLKATDKKKRTAAAFATVRGYKNSAALLGKPTASALAAVKLPQTAKQAAALSFKALQSSMSDFTKRATCVSCHHDGLGRMVTASAFQHGFSVDPNLQKIEAARIGGMVGAMKPLHDGALKSEEVMKQIPLIEMNELTSGYTWLLAGMVAQKTPASPASAAMTMVLAKQQSPEGFWSFSLPRIPMQSSFFTYTALSVQSLNAFGPKTSADEIKERIGRAKQWLLNAPAKTGDDHAFRLLGLKWCGSSSAEMQNAVKELKAGQQTDGGWAQAPGLGTDAYATGLALYALHNGGGMPTTDPVYKRGVQFLLRTQDSDGTWFVTKRALPANNYLDAGYRHGESQYSSFNGACWATLALLDTLPKR